MVDGGALGGTIIGYIYKMLGSGLFWASIIIAGIIAIIIGLKWRKKRRLKQNVVIVHDLGSNRVGMTPRKAGYFKKDRVLFGLWERGGEDEFLTNVDEVIYGATPEDYHEYDGERTLFVTPNPDDPKMLFPCKYIILSDKTKSIMFDIAPIEIREAAVDAFVKTTKEMKDIREQIVQWVLIGLFFIVAFLVILFITQYGKHAVDAASETQKQISSDNKAAMETFSNKLAEVINKDSTIKSPDTVP